MTEREAMYQNVLDEPFDLGRRLAYADFLEESGRDELHHAEFIRAQLAGDYARGQVIMNEHYEWFRNDAARVFGSDNVNYATQASASGTNFMGEGAGVAAGWTRGFLDSVTASWRWLRDHADIVIRTPLLTVHVGRIDAPGLFSPLGFIAPDDDCRIEANSQMAIRLLRETAGMKPCRMPPVPALKRARDLADGEAAWLSERHMNEDADGEAVLVPDGHVCTLRYGEWQVEARMRLPSGRHFEVARRPSPGGGAVRLNHVTYPVLVKTSWASGG